MRWPASMPSEFLSLLHCSINLLLSLPQRKTGMDHTLGFWCLCTRGLGLPNSPYPSIPISVLSHCPHMGISRNQDSQV